MSENERNEVPWHLRTWSVVIRGERVELSHDTTVAEIREKLPSHLVEEFNEQVEHHNLHYLAVEMGIWNLPTDKLLAYRREMAERLYRTVAIDHENVVVPDDIDVDAIMRTHGNCLLGTHPDLLPAQDDEA